MNYLIRCLTLFDITASGVRQRTCPVDTDHKQWLLARNQQCNLDTILQAISIRALPETTGMPRKTVLHTHRFGTKFKRRVNSWIFEFTVADISMWAEDNDRLYNLKLDCANVPMIACGTETANLGICLQSMNAEENNIYFEILEHASNQ